MGAPMPRPTLLLVALSWVALQLPWERCTSDCHDHVEALAGAHDCHDEERGCDGKGEAEHERIVLVSLAPQGNVAADVAFLAVPAFDVTPPRLLAAAHVDASGPRAPPRLLKSVVLLL
jgi:hypothetical protein